jgi:predicted permease
VIPDIFPAVLPVFLIMGLGALFQRGGWVDPALDTGIMRLNLRLFFPCFILDKVIGDPVLDTWTNVLWPVTTGYASVAAGLGIGTVAAAVLRFRQGEGRRTFTLAAGIQNYGFMALPVTVSLFGEGPLGLLFLYGMGIELAMWTIGIMVLRGTTRGGWRSLLNGPCLAVLAGLALHYLGADGWIPGSVRNGVSALGTCAVPIALFATGLAIAAQAGASPWTLQGRTLAGAFVVRLCLVPACLLAMARYLPLSVELKQILAVQAAMPSAVFPIILAKLYGGHVATAIQVVLGTTILCLATMPWILKWGVRWIGL